MKVTENPRIILNMIYREALIREKVLIVIPDWGLAWNVYCLEYAVELAQLGVDVSVLDLSIFNPKIFKKRFWRLILNLVQKNRLRDIKRRICKTYDIKIVSLRSPRVRDTSKSLSDERENIFRSAMASKYSDLTGRRDTKLSEIGIEIVNLERYFFFTVVESLAALQKVSNFHQVITVNGRYIVDGAVIQACKELNADFSLIEAASSTAGKYAVYRISPHDIPSVQNMQLEFWEAATSDRIGFANLGLDMKVAGMDSPGHDYRSNFKSDFAKVGQLATSKIAAFFPSSDREFAIFPEFIHQRSFDGNQHEAFLAFSKVAKENGYKVVVRVHPVNSKATKEFRDRFASVEDAIWQNLCEISGAEIITALSPINSYDLIQKAEICVTYASSISTECILSGKKTLILGESEISYLVPEICAFTEAELRVKLEGEIPVISRETLYPYGYWLQCGGKQPKLFDFISDQEVYFEAKLVNEYRLWAKPLIALKNRIASVIGS
jgi:hypothetical protein